MVRDEYMVAMATLYIDDSMAEGACKYLEGQIYVLIFVINEQMWRNEDFRPQSIVKEETVKDSKTNANILCTYYGMY